MAYEFDCRGCRKRLRVSNEAVDQLTRCPHCEETQIPSQAGMPTAQMADPGNPFATPPKTLDGGTDNPYRAPIHTDSPSHTTSNQPPLNLRLAEPGDRLIGAIIDMAFFIACVVPGGLLGAVLQGSLGPTAEVIGGVTTMVGMAILFGVQYYLLATSGQSIGKRLMKTRIVLRNGTQAGFLHSVVLRNWVLGLCSPCYPIAGILKIVDYCLIFTETRQCLHDLIASTYVITEKDK